MSACHRAVRLVCAAFPVPLEQLVATNCVQTLHRVYLKSYLCSLCFAVFSLLVPILLSQLMLVFFLLLMGTFCFVSSTHFKVSPSVVIRCIYSLLIPLSCTKYSMRLFPHTCLLILQLCSILVKLLLEKCLFLVPGAFEEFILWEILSVALCWPLRSLSIGCLKNWGFFRCHDAYDQGWDCDYQLVQCSTCIVFWGDLLKAWNVMLQCFFSSPIFQMGHICWLFRKKTRTAVIMEAHKFYSSTWLSNVKISFACQKSLAVLEHVKWLSFEPMRVLPCSWFAPLLVFQYVLETGCRKAQSRP